MQPLTPIEIVQLWEWGQHKHPVDRALGMLTLAQPEYQPEQIAALSIGQRNRRLLRLREQTLGPTLCGIAECTRCKEKLEFTVEVSSLCLAEPEESEFDLKVADYELHCRLPNSSDLAGVVGCSDVEAARQLLIQDCVVDAKYAEQALERGALPEGVIPALADAVLAHDPQIEMSFDLECPACGQQWSALFDISTFFWTELSDQAQRLLYDVHLLAQAYGWREADILTMSARRRQMYLEWAGTT